MLLGTINKCHIYVGHNGLIKSSNLQFSPERGLFLNFIDISNQSMDLNFLSEQRLRLNLLQIMNYECLYILQISSKLGSDPFIFQRSISGIGYLTHVIDKMNPHIWVTISASVHLLWIRITYNISDISDIYWRSFELRNFRRAAFLQISSNSLRNITDPDILNDSTHLICYVCAKNKRNTGETIYFETELQHVLKAETFREISMKLNPAIWHIRASTDFTTYIGPIQDQHKPTKNKKMNQDLGLNLIIMLLKKENASGIVCPLDLDIFRDTCDTGISGLDMHLKIDVDLRKASNYLSLDWVSWREDSVTFLSCFVEQGLSFMMYLKPFHIKVWITLLISSSILAAVITLLIRNENTKLTTSSNFSPTFFVISTRFEEGYAPRWIENRTPFRVICAAWFLMVGIVLTNLYLGEAISELSPLPISVVDKFTGLTVNYCNEETDCPVDWMARAKAYWDYDWLSGGYDLAKNNTNSLRRFNNRKDFKIYSFLRRYNGNVTNIQSYTAFLFLQEFVHLEYNRRKYWEYYTDKKPGNLSEIAIAIVNLHNPQHVEVPGLMLNTNYSNESLTVEKSVEDEITKCGRRALLEKTSIILNEQKHLSRFYLASKFTVSKETVEATSFGWHFEPKGFSLMPAHLKRTIEGGIVTRLMDYKTAAKYRERRRHSWGRGIKASKVKRLEIGGSIQTIFVMWALLIVFAGLVIIKELWSSWRTLSVVRIIRFGT